MRKWIIAAVAVATALFIARLLLVSADEVPPAIRSPGAAGPGASRSIEHATDELTRSPVTQQGVDGDDAAMRLPDDVVAAGEIFGRISRVDGGALPSNTNVYAWPASAVTRGTDFNSTEAACESSVGPGGSFVLSPCKRGHMYVVAGGSRGWVSQIGYATVPEDGGSTEVSLAMCRVYGAIITLQDQFGKRLRFLSSSVRREMQVRHKGGPGDVVTRSSLQGWLCGLFALTQEGDKSGRTRVIVAYSLPPPEVASVNMAWGFYPPGYKSVEAEMLLGPLDLDLPEYDVTLQREADGFGTVDVVLETQGASDEWFARGAVSALSLCLSAAGGREFGVPIESGARSLVIEDVPIGPYLIEIGSRLGGWSECGSVTVLGERATRVEVSIPAHYGSIRIEQPESRNGAQRALIMQIIGKTASAVFEIDSEARPCHISGIRAGDYFVGELGSPRRIRCSVAVGTTVGVDIDAIGR